MYVYTRVGFSQGAGQSDDRKKQIMHHAIYSTTTFGDYYCVSVCHLEREEQAR